MFCSRNTFEFFVKALFEYIRQEISYITMKREEEVSESTSFVRYSELHLLYSGFNTKCVHAGHSADKTNGAIVPPICLSSTFLVGSSSGFTYSRCGNPMRKQAEDAIASLEGVKYVVASSSGTSAAMLIVHLLKPGYLSNCF